MGIGGSALGPQAVFCALNHLYHNDLPKEVRNAPKFYVVDNVDPEKLTALLDVIDITKTMFNVITKSG
ncbi:MAG: glucose-6-phosphate isomerase, partial [Clostridia bacterium]